MIINDDYCDYFHIIIVDTGNKYSAFVKHFKGGEKNQEFVKMKSVTQLFVIANTRELSRNSIEEGIWMRIKDTRGRRRR